MKRAILIAAVLASGCGGGADGENSECPQATELIVIGDGPLDTEVVIRVAQSRCDRPIVGEIEWVDEARKPGAGGQCWIWPGRRECAAVAWVLRPVIPHCWDATCTSLAHEFGHWCLLSSDEVLVEAWAAEVNAEAKTLRWR